MKVEGISLPPLLLIQSLDKMQCNCHTLSFGWRQGRITKCMPLKYSPDESFFLFFFFCSTLSDKMIAFAAEHKLRRHSKDDVRVQDDCIAAVCLAGGNERKRSLHIQI